MKTTGLLKIATSSLILGSVLIGCGPASQHVASASSGQTKQAVKQAMQFAKQTRAALTKGQPAAAVASGEQMVMLVPDDAGYRQLLGEAYLAAGRFGAAESTLNDSLSLAPNNEKVALKLALVKAALGKQQPAQSLLQEYRDRIAGTDYGLALALAGDPEGAVAVLEPIVRSPNADARARQNLALTYAMTNRWLEARVVAAQDLSPALLNERMTQWANFVRPAASWDQVASMLGVKPAYDAGQPVALALAPSYTRQDNRVAAQPPAVEQAAIAAADPVPAYTPTADVAPVFEMAARKEVVQRIPVPVVKSPAQPIKTALAKPRPSAKTKAPVAVAAKPAAAPVLAKAKAESGKFAVQLGAFDNASKASAAWSQAVGKVAALKNRKATRTGITVNSTNFVRLAVAGIATRSEADQLCASIRAGGAQCFVRGATNASLPVQYAAKSPAKAGIKVAAVSAPKTVAKAPVKPAVKLSNTQPAPKPLVKVAAKPTPKPVAKVVAQAAPKPTKIAAR
jgi:Flp pilus assembly protein TadD